MRERERERFNSELKNVILIWLKRHISLVNVYLSWHNISWLDVGNSFQSVISSFYDVQRTYRWKMKVNFKVFTYPVDRVRCGKPVTLWAHWQFLHKMEGSVLLVRHSTITVVDDVILYSFFSEISLKNSHWLWKKIASKKSKIFCLNRVFGTHTIAHM